MILRELLARFGVQFDGAALAKGDRTIQGVIGSLKTLAIVAGAAVVGKAVFNFVDGIRAAGDELDETSAQLGLSTTAIQQWRFAAQLAGVDSGSLSQSLALLQRNAFEASTGSKEMRESFGRLGVSVTDSGGRLKNADQLLTEVGAGLGGLGNDSERVALSLTLLGRSGRKLLPLFTDGAEGIRRAKAELAELGGGLSEETIAASVEMSDEMDRLSEAWLSFKSILATAVMPLLTRVIKGFVKLTAGAAKFTRGTHIVELALGAVTIALVAWQRAAIATAAKTLIAFAPLILQFSLIAAGIAVVVLIVDDLITLAQGGESVIGEFLDTLFGPGTGAALGEFLAQLSDLKGAWEGLVLTAKSWQNFLKTGSFDVGPLSGVAESDPAKIREAQAREAARSGQIVVNPGETRAEAEARFQRFQGEFAAERATAEAASPRARGRGRRAGAPVGAGGPAGVRVPTRAGEVTARAQGPATVVNQGDTVVTVQARTDADPQEIARVVSSRIREERDAENRRTHAALVGEAAPVPNG